MYSVDPSGASGGLALFYNNEIKLEILYESNRIIDVKAFFGKQIVFMSFVYGHPDASKRDIVWEKISRLGLNRKKPWRMIGDFNELTGNHEKTGGNLRSNAFFVSFNLMIQHNGMLEFPCYGEQLSWRGNRNQQIVRCRLDRALGNEDWHKFFPYSKVDYLDMIGSDHRPILLSCEKSLARKKRQFRFDKRWVGKDGLSEMG